MRYNWKAKCVCGHNRYSYEWKCQRCSSDLEDESDIDRQLCFKCFLKIREESKVLDKLFSDHLGDVKK